MNKGSNIKSELKKLEAELKKSPNNIGLLVRYGKLLTQNKQYDDADKVYQQILTLDRDSLQAKIGLMELYYAKGSYSIAIVIAEEITNKNPNIEKARIVHIKSLLGQNNMVEAQELYNKLVSENPFIFDEELISVFEDTADFTDDEDESWDEFDDSEEEDDWFDEESIDGEFANLRSQFLSLKELIDSLGHSLILLPTSHKLKDVIGMEEAKKQIDFSLGFLKQRNTKNGLNLRSSMCFYGPPACGKTAILHAIHNTYDITSVTISEFRAPTQSQSNLKVAIQFAFDCVSNQKPSCIIMDNLESIAPDRSLTFDASNTNLIYHLWDSQNFNFDDTAVFGATSKPQWVDPDMFRYNRIDSLYLMPLPDDETRTKIINFYWEKTKKNKEEVAQLVKATKGFTYGEIAHSIENAHRNLHPLPAFKLTLDHILDAAADITPVYPIWREEVLDHISGNKYKQSLFKALLK